jgi:hypothetical protein
MNNDALQARTNFNAAVDALIQLLKRKQKINV